MEKWLGEEGNKSTMDRLFKEMESIRKQIEKISKSMKNSIDEQIEKFRRKITEKRRGKREKIRRKTLS